MVDYNEPDDELKIIQLKNNPVDYKVQTVTNPQTIVKMTQIVRQVYISNEVMGYIRDIVVRTREDSRLIYGCSPRASIALLEASKALAACRGRDYVTPDDVKFMIKHVLQHRLLLKAEAELEGLNGENIALSIQNEVPVPVDVNVLSLLPAEEEDEWEDDE